MLDRLYRSQEDEGFSLIELLVVVAIIGILAAIAIPLFLNQRNSAREASVKSDINGAVSAVETAYVTGQKYPAEDATAMTALAVKASPGNTIWYDRVSDTSFKVIGCNAESGVNFSYDSAAGGLQATTTDNAGCTTLPTGSIQMAKGA